MKIIGLMFIFFLMGCDDKYLISSSGEAEVWLIPKANFKKMKDPFFLGKTPFESFNYPKKKFRYQSSFLRWVYFNQNELVISVKQKGYETKTFYLNEFYRQWDKEKSLDFNLKPLVKLKKFLKMKSRQEFENTMNSFLIVDSKQTRSQVYLNGKLVGNTPVTLQTSAGTHYVRLKNNFCEREHGEIVVVKPQSRKSKITIDFEKCQG